VSEAGAYARWVARQGKRIVFLGLNAADEPGRARDFQRRYRWTWPSLVDPERKLALKLGATYQPAFVLIDKQGRFVAGFQSAGTPARWNALLARLP
jgi:hypothetical protein